MNFDPFYVPLNIETTYKKIPHKKNSPNRTPNTIKLALLCSIPWIKAVHKSTRGKTSF